MTTETHPEDSEPIPIHFGGAAAAHAARLMDDPTETLCFCHAIPVSTVIEIIRRSGTVQVAEVTRRCKAGEGCNSCRPDIAALILAITGQEADLSHEP